MSGVAGCYDLRKPDPDIYDLNSGDWSYSGPLNLGSREPHTGRQSIHCLPVRKYQILTLLCDIITFFVDMPHIQLHPSNDKPSCMMRGAKGPSQSRSR